MKHFYLCLPLLFGAIGCAPADTTLRLHHEAKAYIGSTLEQDTFPMPVYDKPGYGGIPYVKLSDYVKAFGAKESHMAKSQGKSGLKVALDKFEVRAGNNGDIAFSFDAEKDEIIVHKGARAVYHYFYDFDPYGYIDPDFCRANKEKSSSTSLYKTHTIHTAKYGFDMIRMGEEIYAPFALFETVFSGNASPTGASPLFYNGSDFYLQVENDTITGCNSSELSFIYNDANSFLTLFGKAKNANIPFINHFAPYNGTLDKDEAYRVETAKIITPESDGKPIPDFKAVISFKKDGSATYQYRNAENGEPIVNPEYALYDNRRIVYTEDASALNVTISFHNYNTDTNEVERLRINKGKTFYHAATRDANFALYDFNATRLRFGEFYGIKERNAPFMANVDARLAPYKDDLLSTDVLTYSLAMARFLYEGVDDGHTVVSGFGTFNPYQWSDYKDKILEDGLGHRRNGLLRQREALKAARLNAGLGEGLQIVGDTAYLTYDTFLSGPTINIRSLDQEASAYATIDSTAFVLKSLQELSANHKDDVKRVVIDLTCNGGGAATNLAPIAALLTGEAIIHDLDYYGGEQIESHFELDLDGDGHFGETEDSYKGQFRYYVLTSSMSFSCANALPGICMESGGVTIVGQRSGGGCSMVDNVINPSGFAYTTSSPVAGALINEHGVYVDNDRGIPVSLSIDPDTFYNRVALNEKLATYENGGK